MARRVKTKQVARRASSNNGSSCGCCAGLLTLGIVIALGIFLAVYLTDAESPSDLIPENFHPGDFIPSLDEFFMEDPFNATTPEDANRWAGTNGRGGLTLELVNALEQGWHPIFDLAVAQWENGDPDVLTLSTSFANPDPDCSPIRGKMKVCNGNYGDTRWKGINIVNLINDEIIESSAKMNEYYLNNGGDDARQYTMCHELGHGFGLPHTDENFNNRNTGECMDYTSSPGQNKQPGPENFAFLQIMYGTVDGGGGNGNGNDNKGGRNGALLRKLWAPPSKAVEIPAALAHQVRQEVARIEQRTDGQEHLDGWYEEHRSEFGSVHSKFFGEGYKVKVAKLLVTPDEM